MAALPLLSPPRWGWADGVPDLPRLPEAEIIRGPDGTARLTLTAAAKPDPQVSNLLAYNGQFPGPLVRLRAGERIELAFENRTDSPSNLHFHGLEVSPGGRSDNPFLVIEPGGRLEYRLDLSDRQSGIHWYHPHVHGQAAITAASQMRGLVGPIVIEDPTDNLVLPEHDDRVVVLHDRDVVGGAVANAAQGDWAAGHEGSQLTINGVPRAKLTCERPWLRLRIVNTSNARYWELAPSDGRSIWRIAQDGPCLAAPEALESLLLPPGARSEIMVPIAGLEAFDLSYRNYSRQGKVYVADFPVLHVMPAVAGNALPALPGELPAPAPFPRDRVARTREIPIGMLLICGRRYEPTHDDIVARLGEAERWILVNTDLMDHPMHLHTWRMEPLDLNGAGVPGPRRNIDTVNLKPGDRMEVGVHFARNPGRSLFHCHIVEHAVQGMMSTVMIAE